MCVSSFCNNNFIATKKIRNFQFSNSQIIYLFTFLRDSCQYWHNNLVLLNAILSIITSKVGLIYRTQKSIWNIFKSWWPLWIHPWTSFIILRSIIILLIYLRCAEQQLYHVYENIWYLTDNKWPQQIQPWLSFIISRINIILLIYLSISEQHPYHVYENIW